MALCGKLENKETQRFFPPHHVTHGTHHENMTTLIAALITTLATIRITRLITTDKIGEPLRTWITRHNGEHGWWTFLIHCPWCTGYWAALPATGLLWAFTDAAALTGLPTVIGFIAAWSALAYITGYTLTNLENH